MRSTSRMALWLCAAGLTAFAAACGGSTSTGTDAGTTRTAGGGTDAGTTTGTTTGGTDAGTPPAPKTYCDGFQAQDSSGNKVLVQTFAFDDELKAEGCDPTVYAYADGTSVASLSGILDLDTSDNGAGSPAVTLFPSNCADFGLSGFTPPTASGSITPPMGAMTIQAAYGNASATTIYGVVTAIHAWGVDPMTMKGTKGTVYLQDAVAAGGTPAPKSGAEVYFSGKNATTYGTAPKVGDVIAVTGVMWSPYMGVNEFAASATTKVMALGTSELPPPVSITAAQASQTSELMSAGYEGMRVSVSGGPFTVQGSGKSKTCPSTLQYTSTGG